MKKFLIVAGLATFALTSCTSIKKTATSVDVNNSINETGRVDLVVSPERVTYNFRPAKKERRAGLQNVKNCAIREALRAHGDAEVMVAPEFDIRTRRGLFGKKIKEVTVYGYPAQYANFRQSK